MKSRVYWVTGITAYLFFLLFLFPASIPYGWYSSNIQRQFPQLQVEAVHGRLWQGELSGVYYKKRALGDLSWQLDSLSLLVGSLVSKVSLQTEQGYMQGTVRLPSSADGINLTAIKGQLPVQELQRFLPYSHFAFDGLATFNIKELVMSQQGSMENIDGRITIHNAAMVAPQKVTLGEIEIGLMGAAGDAIKANIHSTRGELQLAIKTELYPDGRYTISGSVKASRHANKDLTQLLSMLGKADSGGAYRIKMAGRI